MMYIDLSRILATFKFCIISKRYYIYDRLFATDLKIYKIYIIRKEHNNHEKDNVNDRGII